MSYAAAGITFIRFIDYIYQKKWDEAENLAQDAAIRLGGRQLLGRYATDLRVAAIEFMAPVLATGLVR